MYSQNQYVTLVSNLMVEQEPPVRLLPTQPNHSQLAQCGSQVNASRQGQDPIIPHFFQIEPLGIRLSSDPQPGIPSSPLKKPPQVLLQE